MNKIALAYGGRSTEHEVSVNSAKNVYVGLLEAGYEVSCLAISKTGSWYLHHSEPSLDMDRSWEQVSVQPGNGLFTDTGRIDIDAVFPVTHGTEGEDGRLQSLCDLSHIPCIGCNAFSSMVGMKKAWSKLLFTEAGIPIVPSLTLSRKQEITQDMVNQIQAKLGDDIIVKPEAGGSSVGVTAVHLAKEGLEGLSKAYSLASDVCESVLVEQRITPMVEVECAILQSKDGSIVAAGPGMVVPCKSQSSTFLSYEQKYGDSIPATMTVPADIPQDVADAIKEYAKTAFSALGCNGYARVDFFYETDTGRIFLNEINTLPGMTGTSHYPLLIKHEGISFNAFIRTVFDEAIARFNDGNTITHTL